jgi:hypothetical protein
MAVLSQVINARANSSCLRFLKKPLPESPYKDRFKSVLCSFFQPGNVAAGFPEDKLNSLLIGEKARFYASQQTRRVVW